MKTNRFDSHTERQILIGMITDTTVLSQIASRWEKNMFLSKWSNIVGFWCIKYYKNHNTAPLHDIRSLFISWSEKRQQDEHTYKLIEDFLSSLSNEYDQKGINSSYILETASDYFDKVKISHLRDKLTSGLVDSDLDGARNAIIGFSRVELGSVAAKPFFSGIHDEINDKAVLDLVEYEGDIGNFFKGTLERDAFVSFLGPPKSGKTWWLMDMAWRALEQGRKVAFFEVGDLSENQIKLRFDIRMCKKPYRAKSWPTKIKWPISIYPPENRKDVATVEFEERIFKRPLTKEEIEKESTERLDWDSRFKLSVHPNFSINMSGIESILQGWEVSGYVPDMIVIDYADLLAPEPGREKEIRDQINVTWKKLRRLSQRLHCLVVTATQANAASFKKDIMDRSNFSEDNRKLAHVTCMVGINALSEEKKNGIMRLNWIVLREGEYTSLECVYVGGCLALANPCVVNTL